MNYDAVPQELKTRDQWVTWQNVNGTKVPFNPHTGRKASSTNPQTWAAFDLAVKAAQQRKHSGVGYVFAQGDPYTGIDLDDCLIDGQLATWATEIVETMQSYTEISPSGQGLKIWVEGSIPNAVKTAQIEIYDRARYFTVTGQRYDNTPTSIRNVNGALTALYERYSKTTEPTERMTTRPTGDAHAQEWAQRVLARAIEMVTMATDGTKHDILLDAARLAGGAVPYITETAIETALYAAIEGRAQDKAAARHTIRDGIALGRQKPLEVPPPPPQPVFDSEGIACCPVHKRRLDPAKNGNGYKCRERAASTPSGWCDFWWEGADYLPPRAASEAAPVLIAGELITQTPDAIVPPVPRFVLYKLSGLRALPPVEWLIDGEIPASLTTIVCGASGAGKSFLMVDYAIRIARAYPDRAVVYIAPEGGSGYHMRTQAWLTHYGGAEPDNLVFVLQAVPLLNPQAVSEFIATIRPFNPVMVIIDTLARCLVGGDENSAKDIGLFFYHTDTIRQETGSAIAVVHHTGKAGSYRGSSALYGSVESWIDVTNDDGLISVSCGKSKDAKPFAPRYLRMVECEESVVLVSADQVTQRDAGLTEAKRKILETLALDIFSEAGAKRSEIAGATGINELTLYRVLSRLKRDRYISQGKKGDPYFITSAGMSTIKEYHRVLRQQREQLANLQPTSNELAASSSPQLATSSNLHPYRGVQVAMQVASDEGASDSELSPEDEATELLAESPQEAPPVQRPAVLALDWTLLEACYREGNMQAIATHCAIRRQDRLAVLDELAQRTGIEREATS